MDRPKLKKIFFTLFTLVTLSMLLYFSLYEDRNKLVIQPFAKNVYTYYYSENKDTKTRPFANKVPKYSKNKDTERKWKTILINTPFFGEIPYHFVQEHKDYSTACKCDFSYCKLTYNRSLMWKSDAVIFHARDMPSIQELRKLNEFRNQGQRWIYFVLESPINAPDVHPLDKYFNWTLSYRLNSDIRMPYVRHERIISSSKNPPLINYAEGKTKQIAWLASHCGAARDKFVTKLYDYGIKVDVGGGCSKHFPNKLICHDKDCLQELKQYKFFLSAENGFCKDYITEKYFIQGFKGNMVPIVLGGSNYSNPKLTIPGSFINPMDFTNMQEFADYIKMLDKNNNKYNEFFEWKTKWKIVDRPKGCEKFMCDLCTKLHETSFEKDRPISSQLAGDCEGPTNNYEQWIG